MRNKHFLLLIMKEEFNKIHQKAKEEYKNFIHLHCPYFNEKIHFTSEGFNHIRYKGHRKERHRKVQIMRYKLLKFIKKVLQSSKTLQEHDVQKLFIEVKNNKKKEKILKEVNFYGFIAIIDGWKVKVIVRQVGNGKKHFWSIIPNWRTRKSKEGKQKYINHTGNLAED